MKLIDYISYLLVGDDLKLKKVDCGVEVVNQVLFYGLLMVMRIFKGNFMLQYFPIILQHNNNSAQTHSANHYRRIVIDYCHLNILSYFFKCRVF